MTTVKGARFVDKYELNAKGVLTALDDISRKQKKTTESAVKMGDMWKNVIGYFSGQKAISFIESSIDAWSQQEDAVVGLTTALSRVTPEFQKVSIDMQAFASQLQGVSKFGDEVTIETAKLLVNMGVMPDRLKDATRASAALASAFGIGLREATIKVAKANQGMAEGLRELGIDVRDMKDPISDINRLYGDFIVTMGGTTSGRMQQAIGAWSDLKEQVGLFFLETYKIKDIVLLINELRDTSMDVSDEEIAADSAVIAAKARLAAAKSAPRTKLKPGEGLLRLLTGESAGEGVSTINTEIVQAAELVASAEEQARKTILIRRRRAAVDEGLRPSPKTSKKPIESGYTFEQSGFIGPPLIEIKEYNQAVKQEQELLTKDSFEMMDGHYMRQELALELHQSNEQMLIDNHAAWMLRKQEETNAQIQRFGAQHAAMQNQLLTMAFEDLFRQQSRGWEEYVSVMLQFLGQILVAEGTTLALRGAGELIAGNKIKGAGMVTMGGIMQTTGAASVAGSRVLLDKGGGGGSIGGGGGGGSFGVSTATTLTPQGESKEVTIIYNNYGIDGQGGQVRLERLTGQTS